MKNFEVSFEEAQYAPVRLHEGAVLSQHLTIQNSPLLFGCRIGICGTCAVKVLSGEESLGPRTLEEREFLEALAPDEPAFRLACRLELRGDVKLKKVEI